MISGLYSRLSRLGRTAAIVGAVGYTSSLLLVLPAAYEAVFKPAAEKQLPYEPPGEEHYGDALSIFPRLRGVPPGHGESRKQSCWGGNSQWPESALLVRGRGPINGSSVTYWVTETRDRKVYFGRYTFDLSYLVEPGNGAGGFSHSAQEAENLRLIERIPPPAPGPLGWRVIHPGQCVFAKGEPADADGTIGRFLVDLPAKSRVQIFTETRGTKSGTSFQRVSLNGKEAARVPIPGAEPIPGSPMFYYRTDQAGRYEITKHILPDSKPNPTEGSKITYSLKVVWGEGSWGSCSSPERAADCTGELDHD